jgi:hypothetical protein
MRHGTFKRQEAEMSLKNTARFTFFAILSASLMACGEEIPPIQTLTIVSNDIHDGSLPIIRDRGVFVGVTATTADGSELNDDFLQEVEWSTDDPGVIEVHSLGSTCVLRGLMDWFDTTGGTATSTEGDGGAATETETETASEPFEPSATLTARLGEATTSVRVEVILNGAGQWTVVLDGENEISLELEQSGRIVSHPTTGAEGRIDGETLSLDFLGYVLTGSFTGRNRVEGTYSTPTGGSGTWTAERASP